MARRSAETDSSKLATDANLTGEKGRCDHLLSSFPKCRLYITAADHSDSCLLELICYSWDFYTCHNLLVFPPAMWLRCEALRFSLWSVSHFKTEVIFSSVFPVSAWFFFYSLSFCSLLFSLVLPKTSHVSPNPPPPSRSPNRGQYSVAHLCRCHLQHGHQWYVSKLFAPPPASEWSPVHMTHGWLTFLKVSLAVSTLCMSPLTLFVSVLLFVLLSHPLFSFSQGNNLMEPWRTTRTKVES